MSIDVPSVKDLLSSLVASVRATVQAQRERDEYKAEVVRLLNLVQHLEDADARSHPDLGCDMAPAGWYCSREPGHDGPCAARPVTR